MTQNFAITDEKAYQPIAPQVDAIILAELSDGGKTPAELMTTLYENRIGSARNNNLLELSHSSTGGIFRSAVNSLRRRKLIYDSWDAVRDGQPYEKPFRYFRKNPNVV